MVGLLDLDGINKIIDRIEKLQMLLTRVDNICKYSPRPDNLYSSIYTEIHSLQEKLNSQQILEEVHTW